MHYVNKNSQIRIVQYNIRSQYWLCDIVPVVTALKMGVSKTPALLGRMHYALF